MKKFYIFCLSLLTLATPVLMSCGSDDDEASSVMPQQPTVYAGKMVTTVGDFPKADPVDAAVSITPEDDGTYTLRLRPVEVTVPENVPMMGGKKIITHDDLVVKGVTPNNPTAQSAEIDEDIKGMMNTTIAGRDMECAIEGKATGTLTASTLTISFNFSKWGNMPFGMIFDFSGTK